MSSSAMHVAATGLSAQQLRMQTISNNLANASTTGFKRDRPNFESLLYQVSRTGGDRTGVDSMLSAGLAIGTGVRTVNTEKLYSQGAMITTENSLDLAIDGQGFFQVLLPDGTMGYTRAGNFSRSVDGALTTASGYVVQPEITIPDDAMQISIAADGTVSVSIPGDAEMQEVGALTLANFANPRGLLPVGENFLVETPASGAPVVAAPLDQGFGKLVQGSLEGSNVNVVQQLVDMIETQRAYEVSSKSITAVDEMMRFVSNNL